MKFDKTKDSFIHRPYIFKYIHFKPYKFDKCIRDLRSTETNLEKTDIIYHLLTMPSEYDNIVTAIETLTVDNLTFY